jgi:hypothetical protein
MVATDRAPVIQTGIGALSALGGGVIGAWLQGNSQERIEQHRLRPEEDVERQQRRERAAEILAEVSAILRILEMEEQSVVQRSGEEYKRELLGTLEALGARLQAASAQLLGMAIREPNSEVRRLARKLERALSESVVLSTVILVGRALESESPVLARLDASAKETRAGTEGLLDELVEAL